MQSLLLVHAPELAHVPWVDTDGDDRLGGSVKKYFPKAHHGVDANHVFDNMVTDLVQICKMDEKKARHKLRVDFKGTNEWNIL